MSYSFGQQLGFIIGAFIVLSLVVLGVMYTVTGKIPFYPESRFRRNSYRREKMTPGYVYAGTPGMGMGGVGYTSSPSSTPGYAYAGTPGMGMGGYSYSRRKSYLNRRMMY